MNSTFAYSYTNRLLDACCMIGRGDLLQDPASIDPHNTPGGATLISPTRAVTSRHLIDGTITAQGVGRWALPFWNEANAHRSRTIRFPRHVNGNIGSHAAGTASFHQVEVTHVTLYAGNPDIAYLELASSVTHIQPISIKSDYGPIVAGMVVTLIGIGRTGNAPAGQPETPKAADTTLGTTAGLNVTIVDGSIILEEYDSGSAVIYFGANGRPRLVGAVYSTSSAVLIQSLGMEEVEDMALVLTEENSYASIESTTGGGGRLPITAPAGSNRILMAWCVSRSGAGQTCDRFDFYDAIGPNVVTPTFTLLPAASAGTNLTQVRVGYLLEADIATAEASGVDIDALMSSSTFIGVGFALFSGAVQQAPTSTVASGSSTAPAITHAGVADGLVISILGYNNLVADTPIVSANGADQTIIHTEQSNSETAAQNIDMLVHSKVGAASVTLSHTLSSSRAWAMLAISVEAIAAAPEVAVAVLFRARFQPRTTVHAAMGALRGRRGR